MTVTTRPAETEDVIAALRTFTARYIATRRTGGELRTRLVALIHQRQRWIEAAKDRHQRPHARRELTEIERVRVPLQRSARAAAEQTKAIEAVIAAIARELDPAALRGMRPPQVAAGVPVAQDQAASVAAPPAPRLHPRDAAVRGGWSPPAADGVRTVAGS